MPQQKAYRRTGQFFGQMKRNVEEAFFSLEAFLKPNFRTKREEKILRLQERLRALRRNERNLKEKRAVLAELRSMGLIIG